MESNGGVKWLNGWSFSFLFMLLGLIAIVPSKDHGFCGFVQESEGR